MVETLHEAGLPRGVFNIVNGRGDVVGEEIARHPDVTRISFTGSSAVGQHLVATGAATMKRVTLELGGKSSTPVLDDADFARIMPLVLNAGFMNGGQACIASTRIQVPRSRLAEFERVAKEALTQFKSGDPRDPEIAIGPMASAKQWESAQNYGRYGKAQSINLRFRNG